MEKSSEMSLDEVLSSIKKMVIDDEAPVLDLTDMVAQDGSLVKVGKSNNPDMGTFLKLVQRNANSAQETESHNEQSTTDAVSRADISTKHIEESAFKFVNEEAFCKFVNEIASKIIKTWIDTHLPEIASKVVESEIRKVLKKI